MEDMALPVKSDFEHMLMYFDICQRFYWSGMYADVKAYVRNCQPCRQAKATQTSRKDRLKRSINRVPFSVLFVDHVEIPAENPFGYTHILTMMDGFTKFLITEPVTGTDAWKTEAVVWDRVVCALGRIPEVIVCDNGFDSAEWRKFCSTSWRVFEWSVESAGKRASETVVIPRAIAIAETLGPCWQASTPRPLTSKSHSSTEQSLASATSHDAILLSIYIRMFVQ
jgi:hypothetical protein